MFDIIDGQTVIFILAVVLVFMAVAKWYVAEASGKNYYRRNPQAKAFEEGMKSGQITVDNYGELLSKVDWQTSKQDQAEQIDKLCRGDISKQ